MTETPIIETPRLILRAPTPDDLRPWMAFFMTERGRWHGCGPEGGVGRAWRATATLLGHWQIHGYGPLVFVRKSDGKPIGSVGPWFPADWPEPEMSWTVWDETAEGKGYAFEAATAVLDHLFNDLGWTSSPSYIDPQNPRSIALAKRLGATLDPDAPTPTRFEGHELVYRHRAKNFSDNDGSVEAFA